MRRGATAESNEAYLCQDIVLPDDLGYPSWSILIVPSRIDWVAGKTMDKMVLVGLNAMQIAMRWIQLIVLGFSITAAGAQQDKLRSPWDERKVVLTAVSYDCPAPPPFAKTLEIGVYYKDSHASVIDPKKKAEYDKAAENYTLLTKATALAADAYLDKGSRAAASCVYSLLDAAAKADAWDGKMDNFSGVYVQNWLLSGAGISYLKVRNCGLGTPEQEARIQKWFARLALRVREFFDAEVPRLGGPDKENNHIYWAGLAVAVEAIADNDHDAGQWALWTYRMGLANIQPDGSLKAEMNRGQMALHYHLYALGPLIMLAELGEANGQDLYAENGGALHRLVNFCLAGLEDPTILEKRTGAAQVVTLPYGGSDIGWAVPYVRRFPNPQLSALVAKAPWVRYTTWGGAPPE
jgi:poly(beta-D-mannuronate) lyase